MKYFIISFIIYLSCQIIYGQEVLLQEIDVSNYPELSQMAEIAIAKSDSILGRHSLSHEVSILKDTIGNGNLILFQGSWESDLNFHYFEHNNIETFIEGIKKSIFGYFKVSGVFFFLDYDFKKLYPALNKTGYHKIFNLTRNEDPPKFDDKEFLLTWAFYEKDNKFIFLSPKSRNNDTDINTPQ